MKRLVVIPTAGTGSRLGSLTRHLNKSLVPVGTKPVIARIIDQFPTDTAFVIALGHEGKLVREFLGMAYPKRSFTFVEVMPFEGPGSGLGKTLMDCRPYLQTPFIFTSCDTLTPVAIPEPDHNWMGFSSVDDLTPYRTLSIVDGVVQKICEKNEQAPNRQAYIGLAGIANPAAFWHAMDKDKENTLLMGESLGMRALLPQGVRAHPFIWHDTGNPQALSRARAAFRKEGDPVILEKPAEAIWFTDDTVIKFSVDTDFIQKRVKRAKILKKYCPAVLRSTKNMYQYAKASGDVLSNVITLPLFDTLLLHAQKFWQLSALDHNQTSAFHSACHRFYHDKTLERIQLFYSTTGREDGPATVNGRNLPPLAETLARVNWKRLSQGCAGQFHGDFHFENILYNAKTATFTFLDWRQDFGGSLETGDIYYDLAKLLHGLIMSHELVLNNEFSVDWKPEGIMYCFKRHKILIECEKNFTEFLDKNSYEADRVRILTALIFLNIAALHHHPYNELLYCLGRDMLFNEVHSHG